MNDGVKPVLIDEAPIVAIDRAYQGISDPSGFLKVWTAFWVL